MANFKTVEMPDGSTIEFPANMSDGDINKALEGWDSDAAPEDTVSDTAKHFGYGFNRRLADVASYPRRVLNELVEPAVAAVTGTPPLRTMKPGPTERFLRGEFSPLSPPATKLQEGAGRVGEMTMESVPYTLAPFAVPSRMLGPVARPILEGIKSHPWAATFGETGAAATAGTGVEIARQMGGGDAAQLGAGIVGGVAPSMALRGPTGMVIKGGKFLWDRASTTATKEGAERFVQQQMGDSLNAQAKQNIQEAQQLREDIPGFNPTLAESTERASLAADQRVVERGMSGEELDKVAARRSSSEAAIDRYASGQDFESANPALVIDEATGRVARVGDKLESQRNQLQGRQEGLARKLPATDRYEGGQRLRDKEADLRRQASAAMEKEAQRLGILDDDLTLEFQELYSRVQDRYAGFATARQKPDDILSAMRSADKRTRGKKPAPANTIKEFEARQASTGTPYTFRDFKEFRERLGQELRDTMSGSAPNRVRARELNELVDDVDGILAKMADKNQSYKEFRETYYNKYIDRFFDGATFKARQKNGRSFYTTNNEKVGGLYFKAGDVSGAKQFNKVYAGDEQAQADLASHALDDLRMASVTDGVIDPRALSRWVKKHESVLGELPFIKDRVGSIQAATEALSARQAQLLAREERIGRQWISKISGNDTPESVVAQAVKDPRRMRSLIKAMPQEGKRSVRQLIWGGVANGTSKQIDDFMRDNAEVMSIAFSPRHVRALKNISTARRKLEVTTPAQGQAMEVDPLKAIERETGMGLSASISRMYAYKSGRLNPAYLITEQAGRLVNGRSKVRTAALIKEALYDERVAIDLAAAAQKFTPKRVMSRLDEALFRVGLGVPRSHIAPTTMEAFEDE